MNANNIFVNLGGESSSDEEKEIGSTLEAESREVDVMDKTSRSKKVRLSTGLDDLLNQGFLPPRYEILKKADSLAQSTMKFSMHCGKYMANKCNEGDKCRFSHDLDTSPTNRENPSLKASNSLALKSRAYPGVMHDVDSGSFEASVEAQGRYIRIGLFIDAIEAARARDIGTIRMVGFERASQMLSLDIGNYDTIDVKELRQFDEILEN